FAEVELSGRRGGRSRREDRTSAGHDNCFFTIPDADANRLASAGLLRIPTVGERSNGRVGYRCAQVNVETLGREGNYPVSRRADIRVNYVVVGRCVGHQQGADVVGGASRGAYTRSKGVEGHGSVIKHSDVELTAGQRRLQVTGVGV